MINVQSSININYISGVTYSESDMQLILQNLFGSSYNNFEFKITADNKIIMGDSAILIAGQIYLIKGGLDITSTLVNMPSGTGDRINAFLVYNYEHDDETGEDIVSDMSLYLNNDSAGGQITEPIGYFIKKSDGTFTWTKELDERFNILVKSVLAGEVVEYEGNDKGWKKGDIVTLKDNIFKYKRFYVYPRNKNTGDLNMDLMYGVGIDTWDYESSIRVMGMYTNGNVATMFVSIWDNYINEIGGDEVEPNQIHIRDHLGYIHNQTGMPHGFLTQVTVIYKIVAMKY